MAQALAFHVATPLGFAVQCTREDWNFLVTYKHPVLRGREAEVKRALQQPDEVRRSRKDPQVFLFYSGSSPRWICAVAKRQNGKGFLVTAYPADAIKAGERVWTRSK